MSSRNDEYFKGISPVFFLSYGICICSPVYINTNNCVFKTLPHSLNPWFKVMWEIHTLTLLYCCLPARSAFWGSIICPSSLICVSENSQCLFPVGWGAYNERERERGSALALDVPLLPILYLASVGTLHLIVMPVNAESWLAGLFSGLALCCGVWSGTMCLCHMSHVHFLHRSLSAGQEWRQIIPMWKMPCSSYLTMVLKWTCTIDLRGFFTVFFYFVATSSSKFPPITSVHPAAGTHAATDNAAISSNAKDDSIWGCCLKFHSSSDHIVAANHSLIFK